MTDIHEALKPLAVEIDSLTPDPSNARKHNKRNIEAIKASLARFGQTKPIVLHSNGSTIIAGNGTWYAAKELGWTQIAAAKTSLDTAEAVAYGIADNKTAELAEWEDDTLRDLMDALPDDLKLATGFEGDEIAQLLRLPEEPEELDEDETPEVPEEATTQVGDLWLLGDHRLLCGDSTNLGHIANLVGEDRVDLCVTSPPYNSGNGGYKTDYKGKTKKFYQNGRDNRTEDEWVKFCNEVLCATSSILKDDKSVVVWNVMYTARCRSGYGRTMFAGDHDLTVKETICWQKGAGFPTASRGILSRDWELIFVLSKGQTYNTTQGQNEPRWATWKVNRPTKQHDIHKATFPEELVDKALEDFGGSKVYDPFMGSGTTLVACEKKGVSCFGMEIDPLYCDVIVQRWENLTGKKAERVPAEVSETEIDIA